MTIRLSYYLGKARSSLRDFCINQELTTYSILEKFCVERNINCDITAEEFAGQVTKEIEKVSSSQKTPSSKKSEKANEPAQKSQPRRRGRKPKQSKAGPANTKDNT